jgi:integrase/recombinase XerD
MNLKLFQQYLVKRKNKASTNKAYLYVVNRFVIENPTYINYGYNEISKYLGSYIQSKSKRPSMNLIQAGIKQFYLFLYEQGFIEHYPCRNLYIKTKRIPVNPELLFTQKELQLLLNRHERYKALANRNNAIISFLIHQALSVGQICKLRLRDLNMEESQVTIRNLGIGKRRILPLKPSQVLILEKHLMQIKFLGMLHSKLPLFVSSAGGPISADSIHYLISTFKPMFPDRNLNPKTIRKSVLANWLNDFHLPVEDVQYLAGHKQPTSTLKYKLPNISESVRMVNLYFPE